MSIPVSGKTYIFTCVGAGTRVLNLYYPNTIANGQNVCLWTPDGSLEQQWLYSNYRLLSKRGTSYALDKYTVAGNANNNNADIWTANDEENQRINFVSLGGNTVKIKLYHSGLYLTAYSNANGSANGKTPTSAGNVYWGAEKKSDLQKWTFQEVAGPSGKYVWPTESHTITNAYGNGHLGIDIGPLQNRVRGDEIYAFMDGYVSRVATPADNANEGYTVRIHHKNPLSNGYAKIRTQYMHMMGKPLVSVGQFVSAGTLLGYMGNSGNVIPAPDPNDPSDGAGTHLHFEVRGGTEAQFPDGGLSNYDTGTVLNPNPYLDLT